MSYRKQSGLTLVETLAATVIASLISLAVYSILSQSTSTLQNQATSNKEINDAAYALKEITKEIRRNPNAITVTPPSDLAINKGVQDEEILFTFDAKRQIIKKNDAVLSSHVKKFQLSKRDQLITITITNINDKTFSAELYLRKGNTK